MNYIFVLFVWVNVPILLMSAEVRSKPHYFISYNDCGLKHERENFIVDRVYLWQRDWHNIQEIVCWRTRLIRGNPSSQETDGRTLPEISFK